MAGSFWMGWRWEVTGLGSPVLGVKSLLYEVLHWPEEQQPSPEGTCPGIISYGSPLVCRLRQRDSIPVREGLWAVTKNVPTWSYQLVSALLIPYFPFSIQNCCK